MIYRKQLKIPDIRYINDDYRNQIEAISNIDNVVVVTDPPFNIGYHYGKYKDRMEEKTYFSMIAEIIERFPAVIIHYPEALHKISITSGEVPKKVAAWVYNSNTAKQHRDVAWYKVEPIFTNAWQQYKNPNDKRIKERIARGSRGGADV